MHSTPFEESQVDEQWSKLLENRLPPLCRSLASLLLEPDYTAMHRSTLYVQADVQSSNLLADRFQPLHHFLGSFLLHRDSRVTRRSILYVQFDVRERALPARNFPLAQGLQIRHMLLPG